MFCPVKNVMYVFVGCTRACVVCVYVIVMSSA